MRTVYVITQMSGTTLVKQEAHTDPSGAFDIFVRMSREAGVWSPLAGAFTSAKALAEGMQLMSAAVKDVVFAKGCTLQE